MKKKLDNHSPSNNKDKVSIEAKFSTNEVEARQTKRKIRSTAKKVRVGPAALNAAHQNSTRQISGLKILGKRLEKILVQFQT